MVEMCIDISHSAGHLLTFRVNLRVENALGLEKLNLGVKDVFAYVLCEIFSLTAHCHEIRGK